MGRESKILYHIVLLFTIFNTELYNLWHLFSVTVIEVVSIHFHFPSFAPRQNAGIGFRNRRWKPRAHLDKGGEESKVGQSKLIAMWKLPENHCDSFSHKHKSKEFSFKSVESFKSRWLYLNVTTGELISLAEPSFKSQEFWCWSHMQWSVWSSAEVFLLAHVQAESPVTANALNSTKRLQDLLCFLPRLCNATGGKLWWKSTV